LAVWGPLGGDPKLAAELQAPFSTAWCLLSSSPISSRPTWSRP